MLLENGVLCGPVMEKTPGHYGLIAFRIRNRLKDSLMNFFANLKEDRNNTVIGTEGIPQSTTRQNSSENPSTRTPCRRNNRVSKEDYEIRHKFKNKMVQI